MTHMTSTGQGPKVRSIEVPLAQSSFLISLLYYAVPGETSTAVQSCCFAGTATPSQCTVRYACSCVGQKRKKAAKKKVVVQGLAQS